MNRILTMSLLIMSLTGCDGKDPVDTSEPIDTGTPDTDDAEDADGDGFDTTEDCDDADAAINPDAAEVCDEVDNNCDGTIDEGVTSIFYEDADGDGYGTDTASMETCTQPSGYVDSSDDCDDTDPAVSPGETTDSCDGIDNDCDDAVDEDATFTTLYPDTDGDGFGDGTTPIDFCDEPPADYLKDSTDCDDTNGAVSPAALEDCTDGIDNDCDGGVDLDCIGWAGSEAFEYGADLTPGTRACELLWDADSIIQSASLCVDCDFGFVVDMTYDKSTSYDDGTCKSLAFDATWEYAYNPSYNGEERLMIYNSTYSYWYAWAYVEMDKSKQTFSYGTGYEDYSYYGYYYTNFWSGDATVSY